MEFLEDDLANFVAMMQEVPSQPERSRPISSRAARLGAGHATELAYVFGNFGTLNHDPTFWLGGRKAAVEVSGRIQRRWLAFAGYGVPAALDGSRHWVPYQAQDRKTLVIDTHDTLVADPDRELRVAWGDRPMGFR